MHPLLTEHKEDFDKPVAHFKKEIATIRTGNATPALVEHVHVEVYGVKTPLSQLASLSVSDPKTLLIEPWDKNILKEIEKGIIASDLGVNPVVDGERIRLSLPPMTEETRLRLVKNLKERLEESKIAIRQVRDKARERIISKEREKEISEDDRYRAQRDLDEYVHTVQDQLQKLADEKEASVMTL